MIRLIARIFSEIENAAEKVFERMDEIQRERDAETKKESQD